MNVAQRSRKWPRHRKQSGPGVPGNPPSLDSKVNLPAIFPSLRMPWLDSAPLGCWPEVGISILGWGFMYLHGRGGAKHCTRHMGPHLHLVSAQLCTVSP